MSGGRRTMKNTKERLERPGQPEPPVDYFLVVAHFEEWYVSREMAQAIEASHVDSLAQQVRSLSDSASRRHGDTTATGGRAHADSLEAARDSLSGALGRVTTGQAGLVLGEPGGQRWGDIRWWIGIIASTLLVSLGAPFWHDLLETVFGLKNRIRAQAASISAGKPA